MITLADFVAQRFNPDHVWNLKPSGQAHYADMLSCHILPKLGRLRLRDITPIEIQSFLTRKRIEGYISTRRVGKTLKETRRDFSAQTLRHMRNVLSAVFEHAKRLNMFAGENPALGASVPKGEAKERQALTGEEAMRLVAALPAGQYRTLGALLVTTGLRIGEAAGLRWKRVDFERRTITVAENYTKRCWTTPKSKKGIRTVPVAQAVLTALALLKGEAGPEDTVFVTMNGNPLDQNTTCARFLKPAAKRAGVPWATWHSFRHSNATFADAHGMTIAERQKVLGHAEARMTIHYTHPELERVRSAIESIALAVLPADKTHVM
jgi:integrase